jgi:hypothetical protein
MTTITASPTRQLAYTIAEAVQASGLGRTSLFEAMNSGRLRARKVGSRTIILDPDLRAFLAALPEREPSPQNAA